ncbi:protein arginine N-methyltransferase [Okeania sp. KiyG1]|uniref:protein arginine N-methyltransferase n=1 Tax=Okeania sp. KiyG1 TaxID=2720165 RepID=UPI0019C8B2D5|nr:FkbM family methyltransferase [Okeania sp. KiyG1]GGA56387.1 hypothetical protein CYANOKiyG1_77250 [Okeania sp. KiyG1]
MMFLSRFIGWVVMGNEGTSAGQFLKQANQLKRAGRLDEAIALYHQAIEINPNFAWLYSNLGDAFVKQGKLDEAIACYLESLKINPNSALYLYSLGSVFTQKGDLEVAVEYLQKAVETQPNIRKLQRSLSQVLAERDRLLGKNYLSLIDEKYSIQNNKASRKERCLFIDCGGYDGCSAIKFLMTHLNYDCITFEPNPDLWDYYKELPTKLIKKAVFTYDGQIEFTVDPLDGDGSSLLKDKKIDFYGKVSNADCPVLTIDCIDLSAFISQVSQIYSNIILKLDVEGAEYDILEKMLQERTVRYLDKLYCEFHWRKVNIPKKRHDRLTTQLQNLIEIEEWDSQDMGIHGKASDYKTIRENVLKSIQVNRKLLGSA